MPSFMRTPICATIIVACIAILGASVNAASVVTDGSGQEFCKRWMTFGDGGITNNAGLSANGWWYSGSGVSGGSATGCTTGDGDYIIFSHPHQGGSVATTLPADGNVAIIKWGSASNGNPSYGTSIRVGDYTDSIMCGERTVAISYDYGDRVTFGENRGTIMIFSIDICGSSAWPSQGPTSRPTIPPLPTATPSPDPTTETRTTSASSCTELGWGRFDNKDGTYVDLWPDSDQNVCGETDFGMGGCSGAISWGNTRDRCQDIGARMCTLVELQNDEARGTGCNYDGEYVWSQTPCAEDEYYAAMGSSSAGNSTLCVPVNWEAKDGMDIHARCCADDATWQTPLPSEEPTYHPTPEPTKEPSLNPTQQPTPLPTEMPTDTPTPPPSQKPSPEPTVTQFPTTWEPSAVPTHLPTSIPTKVPTEAPTALPSETPASLPTSTPTESPLVKCDFTHRYLCPNGCHRVTVVCNEVSAFEVDAEVDIFDFDDSVF